MQVYPFDGYLTYFPSSYAEMEVERSKLKDFAFPVSPEILENKGTGLTPIRRNGQDFFNVRELIGYARMYSIPDEGYIAKKPILLNKSRTDVLNLVKTEMGYKQPYTETFSDWYTNCPYTRRQGNPKLAKKPA